MRLCRENGRLQRSLEDLVEVASALQECVNGGALKPEGFRGMPVEFTRDLDVLSAGLEEMVDEVVTRLRRFDGIIQRAQQRPSAARPASGHARYPSNLASMPTSS